MRRTNLTDETGANLVEYAFLVVLIAVVSLAAVAFLGDSTSASGERSADQISRAYTD